MCEPKTPEEAGYGARVDRTAKELGEHFDAVVILCSIKAEDGETLTVSRGAGNLHARFGLVQQYLSDQDENIRIAARKQAEKEES